MNNKKDCLKEIIHKIEFVQNSIGDLQKKIKDVILYLEDASSSETTESGGLKRDDTDTKREL